MKPFISIITPNYNYSQYIGALIESVISQGYDNYEHIIVDDGSTDNSVEIIKEYIAKYSNKIIPIQQENKGQTAAINVGLRVAKGDLIGWINSNDTYCNNTFNIVVSEYEKKQEIDIFFGDMNCIDLQGNFIYRRRHLNYNYLSGHLLGFTVILSSNAVFWKRHIMDKNGLLNESLMCNMDGEFYSRLTINAKVFRIKAALANFRKQPFTKASEKNPNWDQLVKKEVLFELENSYSRLSISKYIPFSFIYPVKSLVRIRRIILRLLNLHFIKQFLEKKNINKSINRMKVVILTYIPSPYRVAVFDHIANFWQKDFCVLYCAKNHPAFDWKEPSLRHNHFFLKERAIKMRGHIIPNNPGVFKKLRELNPDVIITCGFSLTMIKAIIFSYLYKKVRIVNSDSWQLNESKYSFLHILIRKILYRYTHGFIAVSKKGAENFKRYNIPNEKIFISPYAIDNDYSSTFINSKRKYDLMFSGQMIERKMPFFFCDIVNEICKVKKDLKVLVLGSGELRDQMLERLNEIKVDYYYPGFIQKEELPTFYSSSKIFLFPTQLDSWGVVANDASAVGTPVITCDNAGAAGDLIIHDYNGYVLPLNVNLWVDYILNLLNNQNLYNDLSENALIHIKKYSPEKSARDFIDAVKNVFECKNQLINIF